MESCCFAKNMFLKKGKTGLPYERVKRNSHTKCRQCLEADHFLLPSITMQQLGPGLFNISYEDSSETDLTDTAFLD